MIGFPSLSLKSSLPQSAGCALSSVSISTVKTCLPGTNYAFVPASDLVSVAFFVNESKKAEDTCMQAYSAAVVYGATILSGGGVTSGFGLFGI